VHSPFVQQFLDSERVLQPNQVMEDAATALLAELARWTHATEQLRA
jgi:hypothetical protein